MKIGKYIKLKDYNNVKIGYGTVDYINLKTIYLKLNSWIEPNHVVENYSELLKINKRKIKLFLSDDDNKFFKRENIVDLDVSIKGIRNNKKSFMNIEVTLFVNEGVNFKSKELKDKINNNLIKIIDILSKDKNLFNFSLNK